MNYPNYPPQQTKKPLHKRAWFWIVIAIGALGALGMGLIAALAIFLAASPSTPQPEPQATVTTEAAETPQTRDVPREWQAALKAGQSVADRNHSKIYVHRTLTSTVYGFPDDAAQYAVDNITGDWNERALGAATALQERGKSNEYIRRTLTSTVYGFTDEEADYAITHLEP